MAAGARLERMTRHVTLITGAPCSGKTTLARKLAQPGDVILDLDTIARQLGSDRRWRHDPDLIAEAEDCMTHALRRLVRTEHVTAWVIRCLPHPAQRAQLARAIRADAVHVLHPPMAEVLARAKRDGRPKGTAASIRAWYRAYRPSEVDSPCPAANAWTAAPSPPVPAAPPAPHAASSTPTSTEARRRNAATTHHGEGS